jgi:guanylate kinase
MVVKEKTMSKQITILCGQSASGKDAILRKLVSDYNYQSFISCTTRPIRENEIDGRDYWFIDKRAFESMIDNNRMVEYRTYNTLVKGVQDTWFYGLNKSEIDRMYDNQNYVVVLDLQGAKSLIDYIGKDKCEVIYIDCPSEIRKERAIKRGGYDEIEWERRNKCDEIDFSEDKRVGVVDREVQNWNRELDDVVEEIKKGGLE